MNNRITINAGANGGSLEIAIPNSAQAITATNNRAQYFASQAQNIMQSKILTLQLNMLQI